MSLVKTPCHTGTDWLIDTRDIEHEGHLNEGVGWVVFNNLFLDVLIVVDKHLVLVRVILSVHKGSVDQPVELATRVH